MQHLKNFTLGNLIGTALVALCSVQLTTPAESQNITSYFPAETAEHEGTWLQWPHHYTYGVLYRDDIDPMFVAMTEALVASENVHIIAYNAAQITRITGLLNAAAVPLANVDFTVRRTDDCWVRDNGPVFVSSLDGSLKIQDWGFNGWGLDTPYALDEVVPAGISSATGFPRIDLNSIVLEGGAITVDGNGVLMATRSSILEPLRNPGLTQAQLEGALTTNLGVTKFVWLDGAPGGQEDITDMHIDGFAAFATVDTLVTMSSADLLYWGLSASDVGTLYAATDVNDTPYNFVQLPLSANNVVTTYGFNLGFRGSYVNFYVGNSVVMVPTYNDPNDAVALSLMQAIFPARTVVGIDSRNLIRNGGMVHCVTQQQIKPNTGYALPYGSGVNPANTATFLSGTPSIGNTFVLGVRDTTGSMALGSNSFLVGAVSPDFAYPGGTLVSNSGMSAPGSFGELLVNLNPASSHIFSGVPWAGPGSPCPFSISLPPSVALIGAQVFSQGALVDSSGRLGLTNGLRLFIGQ